MTTISTIFLSLFIMGFTNAQDVLTQQKILQYCLNIEEVSSSIHPVIIDGKKRIAMSTQEFLSDELLLSVGDIPVSILTRDNLFFNNINSYITVSKLDIKPDKAIVDLESTDGSRFSIILKGRDNFQKILKSKMSRK